MDTRVIDLRKDHDVSPASVSVKPRFLPREKQTSRPARISPPTETSSPHAQLSASAVPTVLTAPTSPSPETPLVAASGQSLPDYGVKRPTLGWEALEHEPRVYGPYWFPALFIAAGGIMVASVLAGNRLFAVFTGIAAVVCFINMRRAPRLISYEISEGGLKIGEKNYAFPAFESFWIFEHVNPPEISLKIKALLHPYIRLPLGSIPSYRARAVFTAYIQEKEQEELISDQISRIIGF